jgi:hypothetical protein
MPQKYSVHRRAGLQQKTSQAGPKVFRMTDQPHRQTSARNSMVPLQLREQAK